METKNVCLTLLGLGVIGINRKFPLSFSLSVHFQSTFTFTSTFRVQLGLSHDSESIDRRNYEIMLFSPQTIIYL